MASASPVDLSQQHPSLGPADLLQQLATFAQDAKGLDRDMYGSGKSLSAFEAHVASLVGKQAGLFLLTGVLAQDIALKVHGRNRNKIVAFHPTCHLEIHEHKPYDHLLGFSRALVGSINNPITLGDVEYTLGQHWKQPGILIFELPQREIGCQCTPWEDVVKISELCRKRNIAIHLDGARLWEAQVPTCHVYLKGSKAQLEAARDHVAKTKNIIVFSALRGVGEKECYFELKFGPVNSQIDSGLFKTAWAEFLSFMKTQATQASAPAAAPADPAQKEGTCVYTINQKEPCLVLSGVGLSGHARDRDDKKS